MITTDTILTWMLEFNKVSKKDPLGHEAMVLMTSMQSGYIIKEPQFVSALTIILSGMTFNNPVSAALFALSIYEECRRRQQDSDDLKKKMK